jgi:signal peptidase I
LTAPTTARSDGGLVRSIAHAVLVAAVRGRRERGGPWGEAVLAEFAETRGGWEATRWAAGGLRAALHERRGRAPRLTPAQQLNTRIVLVGVLAIVAAFLVNSYVVTTRFTPSSSMEPTLQIGDRWLLDMASFRLTGLYHGDVIVVERYDDQGRRLFDVAKRVIGLPGDVIECRGGDVYRDGVALDEPYLPLDPEDARTDCATVTVPSDAVYLLGDERALASDSRQDGPYPMDRVEGRVVGRIWPIRR